MGEGKGRDDFLFGRRTLAGHPVIRVAINGYEEMLLPNDAGEYPVPDRLLVADPACVEPLVREGYVRVRHDAEFQIAYWQRPNTDGTQASALISHDKSS